ncbi:MAG: helix-turn-helix transcriptional regulator [Oscillospiraceae bacterium]|nr:helix-turn-helix transcriptional regulator [Oscillospiraceae bacterium]
MKLQEKIYYCRKKAGLSQDALAEQLGVSRQAISKWETGDAEPEITKLRLLASAFGVTADWLLSEEEPKEEKNFYPEPEPAPTTPSPNWVDSIPGVFGRLLRRYGWLFGVYLAVIGACFTGIGELARYATRRMFSGFIDNSFSSVFPDGSIDQFGNQVSNPFSNFTVNNPVSIMGTFIMVIGVIMIIAGVVLAVVLKKRGER